MVKIRLKRMGSKFKPVYKIVVADARAPRDGKFIEALGHYNPNTKELVLNKELTNKWLSLGAKPTDTVSTLMKRNK
ncbi:30S ribosomal protein S16 [Mycoplasmopsis cynos]|uniref:Small ribosomal subunit protein bS16 n=1 Tax=Mycoplasmopsis cynos TaxID=171284 RepID=A0A449AH68_9BACT|nr:30S ribosomal protein S16 [Mycoplasmopsis cynos]MCU9932642.1 30S ribosomal protein S16 [Mycoplasmopsis cynos]MCU9935142.1 30S ribosomal protein S16 [Mycoplasmopsis cynos]TQC54595.1 30S ribosomal protein S16 [Mycoplasmopsis cynos]UWV80654.1 30S ribosomal protein S16 [Mycoplasmopsis cynos]UWV81126.1 30S ribosomal protein S16 [Mycoplasmopsis cynos]